MLTQIDLLGVPDKDVWAYGESLRRLAERKGYDRLAFSRLRDLVCLDLPEKLDEMTYVANASNFRRALLNTFMTPNWEWKEVKQSEDVCQTYRGYIKFLETDLEYVYPQGETRTKSQYKRGIEYIAKQMLARGDVRLLSQQHLQFINTDNRHSQMLCIENMAITFGFQFIRRQDCQRCL